MKFFPGTEKLQPLQVAAGAIEDEKGRILVAKRAAHRHQGGLWEFPGGKLEPGENGRQALTRELWEELGIELIAAHPLIRIPYSYPDRRVVLDVWRVTHYHGEPHGREGQPLQWRFPDELPSLTFPPANEPIITALRLPPLYVITPSVTINFSAAALLAGLEQALLAGAKLFQLRSPGLTSSDYQSLAAAALTLCHRYGARLLLNASPALAQELGADGVHLNGVRLTTLTSRPWPKNGWVAASCHSAAELASARRIGADFVVLSPVRPTTSHPGSPILGWEGFAGLVREAALPVYGLGGMTMADVPTARSWGGQGIAAISAVWDDLREGTNFRFPAAPSNR